MAPLVILLLGTTAILLVMFLVFGRAKKPEDRNRRDYRHPSVPGELTSYYSDDPLGPWGWRVEEGTGTMSVICEWCDKKMDQGNGCTFPKFSDFADGIERDRVPYDGPGEFCHDCNVAKGQLHHPGCDMERCPKCGGQAIGCDCCAQDDDDEPI